MLLAEGPQWDHGTPRVQRRGTQSLHRCPQVSLCPLHPQDQRLNIIATDHAYRRNFTATSLKPTREIDVEETINTIIDMIVSTAQLLPSLPPPQAPLSLLNPFSLLSCLAET